MPYAGVRPRRSEKNAAVDTIVSRLCVCVRVSVHQTNESEGWREIEKAIIIIITMESALYANECKYKIDTFDTTRHTNAQQSISEQSERFDCAHRSSSPSSPLPSSHFIAPDETRVLPLAPSLSLPLSLVHSHFTIFGSQSDNDFRFSKF